MKYFKHKELKLYCFSPPVMLATFIIEIALAIWTLYRYKLNEVGMLVVTLLVLLAVFQVAEYNVCEGGWIDATLASRVGYAAITFLPPLGIHLGYALAGTKKRLLLVPAYITGAVFAVFFLFVGTALNGHACMGNYAIFQMTPEATWVYALYYYGWVLTGIWLFLRLRAKQQARSALTGLAVGYLAFLVPTTAINLIEHTTVEGIPSVMCGFAVLFALVLAFWVMPKAGVKK